MMLPQKRVLELASKQQMMLLFPSGLQVIKSYQIVNVKFYEIKQQQTMLPFLSINVVHSELPDCLFQFWPNEVKMPKVIEDGKSYQNVLTNVFNI